MLTFEKMGVKKNQQQEAVESKSGRMSHSDVAALLTHPHGPQNKMPSPPKTPVARRGKDQAGKIVL